MKRNQILIGDCLESLRTLPDCSVHCVVTSPPYWGLRDYGVDGQLGLEKSPEEYVANMVEVFREVRRVLRNDGTLWLNLGDSYAAQRGGTTPPAETLAGGENGWMDDGSRVNRGRHDGYNPSRNAVAIGLKHKDLVGIPWRTAFALQADGYYLRQDIIWCLSGGTYVYARTQKGDMPMMVRDAARLDPHTVKLWNGERWTQVLGWSRTSRNADELEIVLRSGERISCTPTHQFPTDRGLLRASEIAIGDTLQRVNLPEPETVKMPTHIGNDAAWFAGLYLAEGSMSGEKIQISGNASQTERFERVAKIATDYGGSATCTIDGNKQNIRVYGKMLVAIVRELVSGRTAKDKCLAPICWRYGNDFLHAYLDGYLSGDGHYDRKNGRWRLGFTRNYNLERDLRTMCARLGLHLVLSPVLVNGLGRKWPAFRGEIRFNRSGHHNEKDTGEVVEIRSARCREVYDVGVEDEPHTFALASGVLTHNSKPNPMPESVRDRCTKSHEYLFLLTKSERYYYDGEAIKEPNTASYASANEYIKRVGSARYHDGNSDPRGGGFRGVGGFSNRAHMSGRNRRSVWLVSTHSYKGAHFATFPPRLVEPCILAGTSAKGCCPACGKPWERITERTSMKLRRSERTHNKWQTRSSGTMVEPPRCVTTGWQQSCRCEPAEPVPCIVLDPFGGSGTAAMMAAHHGRDWLLCELNPEYAAMAEQRIADGYTPPKVRKPRVKKIEERELYDFTK